MDRFIGNCVLAFFILMAALMYWLNYTTGIMVFLGLGAAFELLFWLGIFSDTDEDRAAKE